LLIVFLSLYSLISLLPKFSSFLVAVLPPLLIPPVLLASFLL
jgi:hypothetical protein